MSARLPIDVGGRRVGSCLKPSRDWIRREYLKLAGKAGGVIDAEIDGIPARLQWRLGFLISAQVASLEVAKTLRDFRDA